MSNKIYKIEFSVPPIFFIKNHKTKWNPLTKQKNVKVDKKNKAK